MIFEQRRVLHTARTRYVDSRAFGVLACICYVSVTERPTPDLMRLSRTIRKIIARRHRSELGPAEDWLSSRIERTHTPNVEQERER